VLSLNVPNVLTILRILLVPVVVVALLDETPNGDLLAALVFAFASLTDWVDGWIARSRNSITTFGKLADPVADKLLVIAALVSLVSLDRLDAWVAMVIIARELAVTMTRAAATGQGVVISANRLGKAKTVLQAFVVLVLLLADPGGTAVLALVYAMAALTVLSGAVYAVRYMRGRRIPVPRVSSAPAGSAVGARATLG